MYLLQEENIFKLVSQLMNSIRNKVQCIVNLCRIKLQPFATELEWHIRTQDLEIYTHDVQARVAGSVVCG